MGCKMTGETQSNNIERVQKSYEAYLLASGKRTKGIRHSVNILMEYCSGFDPLLLSYREAQEFQSWMVNQKTRYTPASIHSVLGPLNSFYGYMKKRGVIPVNPFPLIDRVALPVRIPGNIPDEKEMNTLLKHLSLFTRGKNLREYKRHYKAHVLAELLYSTGMRISEAALITLEDVDLINGTVNVHDRKTGSERIAFLNDHVKSILQIYLDEMREKVLWNTKVTDDSLLFGASGNLKTWFNSVLAEACTEMGREKVTSHIFRHAFGYHMLRSGCDIRQIQKLLGHESLNTTAIYTKVDTEELRNILDRYHPRKGR